MLFTLISVMQRSIEKLNIINTYFSNWKSPWFSIGYPCEVIYGFTNNRRDGKWNLFSLVPALIQFVSIPSFPVGANSATDSENCFDRFEILYRRVLYLISLWMILALNLQIHALWNPFSTICFFFRFLTVFIFKSTVNPTSLETAMILPINYKHWTDFFPFVWRKISVAWFNPLLLSRNNEEQE